jgi:DNA-directed RNA polymerase specialized sigma24 family protein
MIITQEQKEFIENIIKECYGYKGNEDLLGEFCDEVLRRAYSFLSEKNDLNQIKVYLKRIANSAILDVIKNQINQPALESVHDTPVCNEPDYNISYEEESVNQFFIDDNQINSIKSIVNNINKTNPSMSYREIFEHRYVKGLNNQEISEALNIREFDINERLLFMLKEISVSINLK